MKYVALLRGIGPMNPNMRNEKLRLLFEKLGFKNVQTVISSGNVLFESGSKDVKKLEDTIEKTLPKELGFKSTTIIRSQEELQRFIDKKPFKNIQDTPTSRLNVTFLKNKPQTTMKFPYRAQEKGYVVLGIVDNAVCTVINLSGAKTPDVMLWLERQFGKEITTRTLKTVMKILAKMKQ